jgi:transposase
MDCTTQSRWLHMLVWLFWFLVVVTWACAYGLPVVYGTGQAASSEQVLGLATVPCSSAEAETLWPWQPLGRWRKRAWLHYQAAQRGYRRALWAARLAYARAAWAAGLARLMLGGALSLATLVDWVTRAQLRRNLGALPVLYAMLELLRVAEVINRHCPSEAEVSHGVVAVVLILNRLTAPRALVKVADWVGRTVLTQTLGVPANKFNDDRLGRTLDAIAQHQRDIWQDIVHEALQRFNIDVRFIFYDLTALVMQGEFEASQIVDYGFAHNTPSGKQKIKAGLSAASDGNVPLDYAPTSGRTADLATVQANMERLCRLLQRHGYPIDQVVIIGDRGTLNDEIALKYDETGLKYLAGLKAQKQEHVELLKAVPEAQFRVHRLTAERGRFGTYGLACCVRFTHQGRTVTHRGLVILSGPMCHAVRQGRAQALRAVRAELTSVRAKIGRKRCRSVKEVQARADTCLRRSSVGDLMRAEAFATAEGRVDLRWWLDTDALWHAMQTDGRYLLATNDWRLSPQRMVELYHAKDGVEKCFCISKQVLRVRPLYVHSDERIQAMLLLNMLALLVYTLLERELRQRGLPLTTRRLIEQLEDLTVIETHCWDGSVLQRLTPVSVEQRQLIAFLAYLVAALRLPRQQLTLASATQWPLLPARPVPLLLDQLTLSVEH